MAISTSTIRDFASALAKHWFSGMSGALSVPLAVATYFVDGSLAKVGLGATAFICVWAAAYLVWKGERENRIASEKKLSDLTNDVKTTLLLMCSVEPDLADNTKKLEWHLVLENTGPRSLEYSTLEITARLDDGEEVLHLGNKSIVRARSSNTYKFPLAEAYDKRGGVLNVVVRTQYGFAGAPPFLDLFQEMKLNFQPRGILIINDCRNVAFSETEIGQQEPSHVTGQIPVA